MNAWTNYRESSTVLVGRIPELSGIIFDGISTRKVDHFDVSKKDIAQYLTKELKHGRDIRYEIFHMSRFIIPRPRQLKIWVGQVLEAFNGPRKILCI